MAAKKRIFAKTHLAILCLLALFTLPMSANAQSSYFDAGSGITLNDVGINPLTNEALFIGTFDDGSTFGTPNLYTLSATRDSLTSSALIGTGADTLAYSISSDGFRIAGVSKSPGSTSIGEGISWLSSATSDPTGIGYVSGFSNTSAGIGAWNGGIVGHHAGLTNAIQWTPGGGVEILAGGNGEAIDVSSNGSLIVGFSADFGASNGAAYWDSTGIHQLADPEGNSSRAVAVAPNASYIGGSYNYFDSSTFEFGTQAALWVEEDGDYLLNALEIYDPNLGMNVRLNGEILDVSDSGYAVGHAFLDDDITRGIIYHEDMLVAQYYDDWLFNTTGIELPTMTTSIAGIAEDLNGNLIFAAQGAAYAITVDVNGVPEPTTSVVIAFVFGGLILRRRRV